MGQSSDPTAMLLVRSDCVRVKIFVRVTDRVN